MVKEKLENIIKKEEKKSKPKRLRIIYFYLNKSIQRKIIKCLTICKDNSHKYRIQLHTLFINLHNAKIQIFI